MVELSTLILLIQILLFGVSCNFGVLGDEVTLLTTEGATTDLKWRVENRNAPQGYSGWEDLSHLYRDTMVRGYQICQFNNDLIVKPESWLLLPGININGASRIYIEMNFTMRVCTDLNETCRETFSVYYCLSSGSLRGNFDPTLYKKIDTVAAETRYYPEDKDPQKWDSTINSERVYISFTNSTESSTLNIAIVDAGACMVLMGVRIFHEVCRETNKEFAVFKETRTGASDTSLVSVTGACVPNSVYLPSRSSMPGGAPTSDPSSTNRVGPLYHCTSSGDWQVITGFCQCEPGFQPDGTNTSCIPCRIGTSKPLPGNSFCVSCPEHSSTATTGANACQCDDGYNVIQDVKDRDGTTGECDLCSKLPSYPVELKASQSSVNDPGLIQLSWKSPKESGGCSVMQYCVFCHHYPLNNGNKTGQEFQEPMRCDHARFHPAPCHINVPGVKVQELRGHTVYNFTVVAFTLATKQRYPDLVESLAKRKSNRIWNSTKGRGNAPHEKELDKLLQLSSNTVSYTTLDTLPSGVRNPTVAMENQTAIYVKWTKPEFSNGKIFFYKVKYALIYEMKEDSLLTSSVPARYVSNRQYGWEELLTNDTEALLTDLYPGSKYEIIILVHNSAGSDNGSSPIPAATIPFDNSPSDGSPNPDNFPYLVATVVIATLVFLICFLLFLQWKCRTRKKKKVEANGVLEEPTEFRPYNAHHDTLDQRTYVDPFSLDVMPPHRFLCEIPPESISCGQVIGCGEFGEVFKGTLATIDLKTGQETTIDVALKRLRDQCEPEEQINFLREAMSLEKFHHPNIVHLEAVVTKSRPFFIVTELMDNGCLHGFLTKSKQKATSRTDGHAWTVPIAHITMAKMLRGVASGMEYLSGRGFVHRDLAARNVLVNSDLVCKVADFGLMRELDSSDQETNTNGSYTTQGGKIAIRWTAPEAIASRTFTQFSDVWSFGILTWEAAGFGEKPYWDFTNLEVIKAITDGMRLPAPEKCPSAFHQLMLECWQRDHDKRPTFTEIITRFDRMIVNPEILKVPASPASCGAQQMFFGDDSVSVGDSSGECDVTALDGRENGERDFSEPLLSTVRADTHKRPSSDGFYGDSDFEAANWDDDEGSEVSSCTSTICASEVTVCARNDVVVYVPILRSDSETDSRPNTPTHHYYTLSK